MNRLAHIVGPATALVLLVGLLVACSATDPRLEDEPQPARRTLPRRPLLSRPQPPPRQPLRSARPMSCSIRPRRTRSPST